MYSARILVADDSPTMRQYIILALQRVPGLQFEEAADGVAALKKMVEQTFDLLVTDLNMPLMSGITLISLLRRDAAYQKLPIVIVTTEGSELTRQKALQAGASEYITKPLQTAKLVNIVCRLLNPEGL